MTMSRPTFVVSSLIYTTLYQWVSHLDYLFMRV